MSLLDHKLGRSNPPAHWTEPFDKDAFLRRMKRRITRAETAK